MLFLSVENDQILQAKQMFDEQRRNQWHDIFKRWLQLHTVSQNEQKMNRQLFLSLMHWFLGSPHAGGHFGSWSFLAFFPLSQDWAKVVELLGMKKQGWKEREVEHWQLSSATRVTPSTKSPGIFLFEEDLGVIKRVFTLCLLLAFLKEIRVGYRIF